MKKKAIFATLCSIVGATFIGVLGSMTAGAVVGTTHALRQLDSGVSTDQVYANGRDAAADITNRAAANFGEATAVAVAPFAAGRAIAEMGIAAANGPTQG